MDVNHMMNKRIKALEDGDEIDRISGLPNDILCYILSFIPVKEAIRTTVLSTRYKDIFAMINNLSLVLYDARFPNQPGQALMQSITNFTIFMNRLIHLNFHSVRSLSLTCLVFRDGRQIANWIGTFLPLNLKRLNLRVSRLTSPTCLSEKLSGCGLKTLVLCIEATTYVDEYTFSLPNLTKLSVIMTPFGIVNALIKGSPSLERLAVINCSGDFHENLCIKSPLLWDLLIISSLPNFSGALEVDAPNLIKFVYRGFLDENYLLTRMSSLQHLQLEVHPNIIQLPSESQEQAMRLLMACCDSRMMWISERVATAVLDHLPRLPQFRNLWVVAMKNMDMIGVALLLKLLEYAPRLRIFCVRQGIHSSYTGMTVYPIDSVALDISQRPDGFFVLRIRRLA